MYFNVRIRLKEKEGEFRWIHGDKANFLNWNINEPNDKNHGANCVYMHKNSKLNDVSCSFRGHEGWKQVAFPLCQRPTDTQKGNKL